MSDTLRPCPFCKGTNLRISRTTKGLVFVQCWANTPDGWCCDGPAALLEQYAIDAWNRRENQGPAFDAMVRAIRRRRKTMIKKDAARADAAVAREGLKREKLGRHFSAAVAWAAAATARAEEKP